MKITKRQLKRIIREEYSRLQRRGLINESYDDWPEIHTSICPTCAELFVDNQANLVDTQGNMWELNGIQFEIVGPDQVKYWDDARGEEMVVSGNDAVNLAPEGEEQYGDWY